MMTIIGYMINSIRYQCIEWADCTDETRTTLWKVTLPPALELNDN